MNENRPHPFLVGTPLRGGRMLLKQKHRYVIGREQRCDIPLPHDKVSRKHARIVGNPNGTWVITDDKSANGSFVNGTKLTDPHILSSGDIICIGPFEFTFIMEPFMFGRQQLLQTILDESADGEGAYIKGEFHGTGLHEVCQFLEVNEKSGILKINSSEIVGQIGFDQGNFIMGTAGVTIGREALRRILKLEEGKYTFFESEVAQDQGFEIKPTALIMETLRELDESGRIPMVNWEEDTGVIQAQDMGVEYDEASYTPLLEEIPHTPNPGFIPPTTAPPPVADLEPIEKRGPVYKEPSGVDVYETTPPTKKRSDRVVAPRRRGASDRIVAPRKRSDRLRHRSSHRSNSKSGIEVVLLLTVIAILLFFIFDLAFNDGTSWEEIKKLLFGA